MGPIEQELENFRAKLEEEQQKGAEANQDQINFYSNTIASLELQLGERQQKQEQKHEELQELVRGYNFNEVFGNPEANKIIHQLLYEESLKHEDQLEEKDQELKRVNEELIAAGERAGDLTHENEKLQARNEEVEAINEQLNASFNKLRTEHEELKVKYEDVLKDSRYHLNESTRFQAKVADLETKLAQSEKQREDFKPSGSLADMVATAKAETEKRKLTNLRQVDRATYIGTNEKGEEETVNWLELPSIEQVQQFRPVDAVSQESVAASDTQADVNQFPSQEEAGHSQTDGLPVDGNETVQQNDGQVSREEFETLKGRVDRLFRVANISEVA